MEQRIEVLIEQLQNITDYKRAAELMAETCEYNHHKFINDIAYGYKPDVISMKAEFTPDAKKLIAVINKAIDQAKAML